MFVKLDLWCTSLFKYPSTSVLDLMKPLNTKSLTGGSLESLDLAHNAKGKGIRTELY